MHSSWAIYNEYMFILGDKNRRLCVYYIEEITNHVGIQEGQVVGVQKIVIHCFIYPFMILTHKKYELL